MKLRGEILQVGCHGSPSLAPLRGARRGVKRENFSLSGSPSIYVKTGDSGERRAVAFCGMCGTALTSTSVEAEPALYNLRLGWVRQRALLPPHMQGFCGSALAWAFDLGGVRRVEPRRS